METLAFVDPIKETQYYIDKYYNESAYKKWFDRNFPHLTIEEAILIKTRVGIADFVDPAKNPKHYINRYNTEPEYKSWFDKNYPEYSSIYAAIGVDEKQYTVEYNPQEPPLSKIEGQIVLLTGIIVVIMVIVGFILVKMRNREGVWVHGVRWE